MKKKHETYVAPYVGAWIETFVDYFEQSSGESHPMWVRGLKLQKQKHKDRQGKSHPMWVRGLKQKEGHEQAQNGRRTLCGCVD